MFAALLQAPALGLSTFGQAPCVGPAWAGDSRHGGGAEFNGRLQWSMEATLSTLLHEGWLASFEFCKVRCAKQQYSIHVVADSWPRDRPSCSRSGCARGAVIRLSESAAGPGGGPWFCTAVCAHKFHHPTTR